MKKYWFRPRRLGYGFAPISWEGWLATLVLIILLLLSAYTNGIWEEGVSSKGGIRFLLDVVIFTCLFTALYKDKVDGSLRWRFWK
ncbi:MAG: hypothetical protein ACD_25C00120G0007 [uncultured bacterium]|uniref:Uncharacterized protein n=1 Tax=candidate division WWE3 bacterium TaxID=2053526 RepID=A0A656PMU1_UNCKA|nr:hypothetical protein P147_WWE3C00001G0366 [candidate division WWE3 bacterium RAAC2_WWE3_1]EKD94990.1 MAG: hypothetical protein ACD_25C00120G0007 [uncultured bacterium]KKS29714.1 MAG: hypothetical protein UU91_C0004G0106 [candidate division WWE3 bacterium GW2011_GWB1_42_117]KKS55524.1 MAG: hypothetical protein UV21_C0001G0106 [candidate division WWE3 bacterium GW2011_GWD2_42_34]KKT06009.1 MAG: hypothetical protein UV83_C0001G0327 [candidate division WWE3 bacterium GW2011_GWE2_43_18]KKT06927.